MRLLIDNLRQRAVFGLHHFRIGGHLHFFSDGTQLHGHIQLNVVRHLKSDARLHVILEPLAGDFQLIGTDRQVWKRIMALRIGYGLMNLLLVNLGDFDLRASDCGACRIYHITAYFGYGYCLG